MKIGKRILSVLLAVLMLALTASVAFAVEEEEKEPLYVVYQLPCFDTWDPYSLSVFYLDQSTSEPLELFWFNKDDIEFANTIEYNIDPESVNAGLLSRNWFGNYKPLFINDTYAFSEHWRLERGHIDGYKLWHFGEGTINDEFFYVMADYNTPFAFEVADKNSSHTHKFEIKGLKYSSCRNASAGSYYCTDCKQTYSITFPASHIYGEDFLRTASTCTDGCVFSRYCARCNAVETESGTPLGHSYDKTGVVVKPTCFTDGYTEVKCTRCEKIQMIDIKPATGNHKDNNKDGYCDTCGTKWPKPAPEPTTQPAAEKDEEKAPKQNIFQRIIEWFKNLFKKLFK